MPMFLVYSLSQDIIGESKGLRQAIEGCRKAAKENDPVMFQGEVSTGKLLLAGFLHKESERSHQPLLIVDCIKDEDMIREILAPGFDINQLCPYEGGSIYFREVASLSLEEQNLLYRALERIEKKKFRIFLSSSQNIHLMRLEKAFDPDLYDYVSQWEISIPPLRLRKEDILPLVHHYIRVFNLELRKSIQGLTPQAEEVLLSYRWPGNVEELKQIINRAMHVANESHISQRHLSDNLGISKEDGFGHGVMPLERMEEILLRSALERYGFTLEGKKRAARALNISLATLYNKLKRYNLNP
ncbi:sigma-54 interacting regulator [Desulfitobacterium dehalogenans ATCC 51507]|uniref:Sigma-54 interacting regulator n=2 Tax=Desulfitobacterium TaxID=36853 RepID=I4AA61_DESDJ|nr:sigma 54-interacting transcriptional regulator [Desulfitobacterium dehalogenans]AFM00846.1 sigma-54 interacting regulator [Desulfitobacterium dehalogenans ATCC 51507]